VEYYFNVRNLSYPLWGGLAALSVVLILSGCGVSPPSPASSNDTAAIAPIVSISQSAPQSTDNASAISASGQAATQTASTTPLAKPSNLADFNAIIRAAGYTPTTVKGLDFKTQYTKSNSWSGFSSSKSAEWVEALAMGKCGGKTISIRYTDYDGLVMWKHMVLGVASYLSIGSTIAPCVNGVVQPTS